MSLKKAVALFKDLVDKSEQESHNPTTQHLYVLQAFVSGI